MCKSSTKATVSLFCFFFFFFCKIGVGDERALLLPEYTDSIDLLEVCDLSIKAIKRPPYGLLRH